MDDGADSDYLINVGTRKSQLALLQTNTVINKLNEFYDNNPDDFKEIVSRKKDGIKYEKHKFNVIGMTTIGDQILDKPLHSFGTKSLFTKELEVELLEGRIDFIVHSLKDLPNTLPEGCTIGAIIKRDSPDDAIVLKKSLRSKLDPLTLLGKNTPLLKEELNYKVGTSSKRRIAMLKRCNPNLVCIDIRGNLNTRLSKLDTDESEYSAIILAKAGLDRMNWSDRASCLLTPQVDDCLSDWNYAVGQGAIAIECRLNDDFIIDFLKPIVDIDTTYEAVAERSLMRKLDGGCSVPLGVRTTRTREGDGMILGLDSIVLSTDGKDVVKAKAETKLLYDFQESHVEDPSHSLEELTTGITLSRTANFYSNRRRNMIKCSELGLNVAIKMIDLGCLQLMSKS